MSIENETSKKVSDEELINDIHLTEMELDAYRKLSEGFVVLSKLPENKDRSSLYYFEHIKYENSRSQCKKFLQNLYKLANERGITTSIPTHPIS